MAAKIGDKIVNLSGCKLLKDVKKGDIVNLGLLMGLAYHLGATGEEGTKPLMKGDEVRWEWVIPARRVVGLCVGHKPDAYFRVAPFDRQNKRDWEYIEVPTEIVNVEESIAYSPKKQEPFTIEVIDFLKIEDILDIRLKEECALHLCKGPPLYLLKPKENPEHRVVKRLTGMYVGFTKMDLKITPFETRDVEHWRYIYVHPDDVESAAVYQKPVHQVDVFDKIEDALRD